MRRSLLILLLAGRLWAPAEPLQEFRLPNGLRVLLAENHERPLVRLALRTSWDPGEEPAGKGGLAALLASLLQTGGAAPARQEAFQRFLDERALRLGFTPHPRSFAWSVLCDSQGQDGAFEGLAAAATRTEFEPAVVEARRQRLLQIEREKTHRQLAEDRFGRRTGDPSAVMTPDEGGLVRIEYPDVLLLARRVLRPERSVLAIAGDMNLAQARQLSMLHLGAWGPAAQAPLPPAQGLPPEPSKATRTWLVRNTGKTLHVRVGSAQPLEAGFSVPTLAVCAHLVQQELADGLPAPLAAASFRILPEGGWRLEVRAEPGTPATVALGAVQGLLDRLRQPGVKPQAWSAARQAWDLERRSRVLHPELELQALAQGALQPGGPEGDGVELVRIQAALGRLLAPGSCCFYVEGALTQDAPALDKAGLGPVEVVN